MNIKHQPKIQDEVHKKRSRRIVKITLILCFVSLGTMCLFIFGIVWLFCNPPKAVMMCESHAYEMNFSSNEKKVGFVRENIWHIPWMEAPIEKREVHFCWRDVAVEGSMRSVKVDSAGDEYEDYVSLPMSFLFSPDSKYAAVASIYNFSLVNLNTGELSRISRPREAVTSFQWLNNDEIGYVVHLAGDSISGDKRLMKIRKNANLYIVAKVGISVYTGGGLLEMNELNIGRHMDVM